MRLKDLERTDQGDYSHYVARVDDEAGVEEFELRFAGPRELVEKALAEATIDLRINSAGDDSAARQLVESSDDERRRSMWELAGFADIDQLLKPAPPAPDRKTSIFASARPVSGKGTPFTFSVPLLFVPTGVSLFFVGPFVVFASALITPTTGDQDLFLRWFAPTGPVVASSVLGGTAPDSVWTVSPFFPFVPVFQVFGFAAGVCGSFTAVGG